MNGMSASSNATVIEGDEVPEVLPTNLGFKSLRGDNKARILATPWPEDALPPPYATLLTVASAHGIYAAGSSDSLVIGKTQDVRNAIYREEGDAVRQCHPLHTLSHSRLAHVSFSSDESCLVVAEENIPEIVVYKTSDLIVKKSNVVLKISTDAPVRTIAPNPEPGSAQYFALVNTSGQLLLADLAQGQLVSGANGPVLAENVSGVTWSTKGKQFIAGRADGTAVQLKPDGTVVATVPRPPSVPSNCFLAQIAWIETDVFYFVYTPLSPPDDVMELVNEFYLVKTNKGRTEFNFAKTPDLLFGTANRMPAHFFMSRLRNYDPALEEMLVVSSSISTDVKVITKASRPWKGEGTSESTGYTITTLDETRSAATPLGQDGSSDTTPIGMCIDLSDKDVVVNPLPTDPEIEDSYAPVPELLLLNNEGVLSLWAIIYEDGIVSQQSYSGFADMNKIRETVGSVQENAMDSAPVSNSAPEPAKTTKGPFAAPLSSASTFTSSSHNTTIESPSNQSPSVFGQPSSFGTGSGFNKPTPISAGENKSSWTSTGFSGGAQQSSSHSQTPAFGSTPTLGSTTKPSFGQPGGMSVANQQSPATSTFGQAGFASKPAFGQPGLGLGSPPGQGSPFSAASNPPPSPFGAAGTNAKSGFSSFANQGSAFGATNKATSGFGSGGSFGAAKPASPFASANSDAQSPFAKASGQSFFGKPATSSFGVSSQSTSSGFGQAGKSGFKLESTFQADTSRDKDDDGDDSAGAFSFGNMLGGSSSASKVQQSPTKEEEMGDDEEDADDAIPEPQTVKKAQQTPPATITQPKATTTPHVSSLFGQSTTPQAQPQQSLNTGWSFGNVPSTTPKDTPAPAKPLFPQTSTTPESPGPFKSIFATKTTSEETPAAVQKSEPSKPFFMNTPSRGDDASKLKSFSDNEDVTAGKEPEAPLPPNPFSKPGYQAGDTSTSSPDSKISRDADDAPLPPDFMPANKTASSLKTQDSSIPSEGLSDEFDGSGEDVTGDVSPVEEQESEEDNEEVEEGEVEEDAEEEEEEEGDDDEAEQTEQVQTSPESSLGNATDRSPEESPTGGPFTKISRTEQTQAPPRPLFGEMGTSAPVFAAPKPQESPRSPSPLRKPPRHEMLSRSPERSFSAPAHPRSVIQERKLEHQQSSFAAQAAQARDEQMAKERARIEAARRAREEAEALEKQPLIDDDDAVLQEELARPIQPTEELDPFIPHLPGKALHDLDKGRTDIPSQIEKLYQDINSMVINLGINARSLSAYMIYQSGQAPNNAWPDILMSDTPMDALNDVWFLGDIGALSQGYRNLDTFLDGLELKDVVGKSEDCQNLLTGDITDLRSRITALRRSTQARSQPRDNSRAPLSAEQASIQQDLRKASSVVLTNLAQVEDNLSMLRAKLADIVPPKTSSDKRDMFDTMSAGPRKPTVEAVMNTVTKMTSMAEKRSADVDVLESQMKKLNMVGLSTYGTGLHTPEKRVTRRTLTTPGSGASSVYHTPDPSDARNVRATPAKGEQMVISVEDREKWQAKARRRKDVANALKGVLVEKQSKAKV